MLNARRVQLEEANKKLAKAEEDKKKFLAEVAELENKLKAKDLEASSPPTHALTRNRPDRPHTQTHPPKTASCFAALSAFCAAPVTFSASCRAWRTRSVLSTALALLLGGNEGS